MLVTRTSSSPASRAKRRSSRGSKPSQRSASLAHRLVVVARVVEDDERAARARERARAGATTSTGRGAWWRSARRRRPTSAPSADRRASRQLAAPSSSPCTKRHVRRSRARATRVARASELRVGAIDRDDALEDRREHLEQRAVAGARVDRERALREERRERREVRRRARVGGRVDLRLRRRLREELARRRVARAEHVRDAREAAVRLAERAPARERVGDDRIGATPPRASRTSVARPLRAARRSPACRSGAAWRETFGWLSASSSASSPIASSSSAASASRRRRTGSASTR